MTFCDGRPRTATFPAKFLCFELVVCFQRTSSRNFVAIRVECASGPVVDGSQAWLLPIGVTDVELAVDVLSELGVDAPTKSRSRRR